MRRGFCYRGNRRPPRYCGRSLPGKSPTKTKPRWCFITQAEGESEGWLERVRVLGSRIDIEAEDHSDLDWLGAALRGGEFPTRKRSQYSCRAGTRVRAQYAQVLQRAGAVENARDHDVRTLFAAIFREVGAEGLGTGQRCPVDMRGGRWIRKLH